MRAVLLAFGVGKFDGDFGPTGHQEGESFLAERHQASAILVLEAFGNERGSSSRLLIGTSARPFWCSRRRAR